MLLVIHNLPAGTRYSDLKSLIQTKCGLTDVILDNLVGEGGCFKKVTVGLADEGDAAILVRKINGLYLNGQQLYVEDVRKQRASDQPYRSSSALVEESQSGSFRETDPKYQDDRDPQVMYQQQMMQMSGQMMQEQMNMMMNYSMGGMMYMPSMTSNNYSAMTTAAATGANAFMGFGSQEAVAAQAFPVVQGTRELVGRDQGRINPRYQDLARQSSPKRNWSPNDQMAMKSRWDITAQEVMRRTQDVVRRIQERRSPSPPSWQANREPSNYGLNQTKQTIDSRNQWSTERSQDRNSAQSNRYFDLESSGHGDESSSNVLPRSGYNDIGRNTLRAPYVQSQSVPRGSFDQAPSASREPFDQGASAPRAPFNPRDSRGYAPQGQSAPKLSGHQGNNMPRPAYDQGRVVRPSFWEDKSMSRPPRPETRRQQEQPRGAKRGPEPHDENPAKRFAGSGDRAFPPPGQAKPQLRPNPHLKKFSDTDNLSPEERKMRNKDETYRGQAASRLSKEVTAGMRLQHNGPVLRAMKAIVRDRIDTVLMQLASNVNEVISAYRSRYPLNSDSKLYRNAVQKANQLKEAGKLNPIEDEMVEDAVKNLKSAQNKPPIAHTAQNKPWQPKNPAQNKAQTKNPVTIQAPFKPAGQAKNPVPVKPNKPTAAPFKPGVNKPTPKKDVQAKNADKKPKNVAAKPMTQQVGPNRIVPNVDKQTRKQIKKQKQEEMLDESLYELPPLEQKALDEEADLLCDLFMGECLEPEKKQEKKICEIISDNAADVFRKVIRLNTTKRILNITTGLQARVMFHRHGLPMPKTHVLEKFFATHGVDGVYKAKQSKQPMYLITCKSFEDFDRLCNMRDVLIEGVQLQIKPFQITGPPMKKKMMQQQRNARMQTQQASDVGDLLSSKKKEDYIEDEDITNFVDDKETESDTKPAVNNKKFDSIKVESKNTPNDKQENVDEVQKSKVGDNVKKEKENNIDEKPNEAKIDSTKTEDTSEINEERTITDTNLVKDDNYVNNQANEDINSNQNEIKKDRLVETGDDDWPIPDDIAEDWDTTEGEAAIAENVDDMDVNEDELEDY